MRARRGPRALRVPAAGRCLGSSCWIAVGCRSPRGAPTATVPSKLSWAGISHVELRPVAAAPLAGSLVLTVGGGIKHSFLVQRCESLADVLSELAQLL